MRKGKCLGDFSEPVKKEVYPRIIWTGFVDNGNFCHNVRIVETDWNTYKFEKEDGRDAMANPIWKPMCNEDQFKALAIHFLETHFKQTETPTDE